MAFATGNLSILLFSLAYSFYIMWIGNQVYRGIRTVVKEFLQMNMLTLQNLPPKKDVAKMG